MMTNKYESNGEYITQKEFLVQDPDGYLLRFTDWKIIALIALFVVTFLVHLAFPDIEWLWNRM